MARRANASAWTARRGRRPQHVRKLLAREPGDLASGQDQYTGPHRESDEPKPMMYGDEKSDPFIVAEKPANGEPERVERREGADRRRGFLNELALGISFAVIGQTRRCAAQARQQ